MPEGAEYCPNCGAHVGRTPIPQQPPAVSVGRIIQAGVLGAFISVMISSLSSQSIQLYFIPSFISSILVIFLFRIKRLEEAVAVAFSVYLFADAILGGIIFGSLYVENISLSEAYRGYMLTFIDVAAIVFNPISALISAYLGITLIGGGVKGERREGVGYGPEGEKEPSGGIIYSTRVDSHSHKI